MLNPEKTDSKRGLKRSWVNSEEQPGPSSSSTVKNKPSIPEKGKLIDLIRVNTLTTFQFLISEITFPTMNIRFLFYKRSHTTLLILTTKFDDQQ